MARRCAKYIGLLVVICSAVPTLATVYTVGDTAGWTIGVDYGTWSTSKKFLVGDTLVFNYGSGHTVDEVSKSDYTTCTVGNPINTDSKGATKILLQAPGTHYFICGVIGHCGNGMKLSVNVLASPSANSTATPTTSGSGYDTLPTTTGNPNMIPDMASSPAASFSPLHGRLILLGMVLLRLTQNKLISLSWIYLWLYIAKEEAVFFS